MHFISLNLQGFLRPHLSYGIPPNNCAIVYLLVGMTHCWQVIKGAVLNDKSTYGILLVAALPGWAIKQVVNLIQVCKQLSLIDQSYWKSYYE